MSERPTDGGERDFRRFRETGDAEAMARVFDAVAPKLLLVAGHLTRDATEAEDLVQTTFLTALEDAARWDATRPLVPWLVGILSHRALDLRRRNQLRGTSELGDVEGSRLDPLELVSDKELRETIARSVDELEEPYREVLILRVAHGLEPTEIAHTLGRSPGTVRMQLKRGREKLERALPRGLQLPAFLLADAGRGLAAVREVVLAQASASVAATASVATVSTVGIWTLGGLTMKAAVVAVGVFGMGVILWAMFGPRPEREIALREAQAGEERMERPAEPLAPAGSAETADSALPRKRIAATPVPGISLGVRVAFEDGQPAPDVGVYLKPLAGNALGDEVRTDESGLARLDGLARGGYSVDLDRWSSPPVELDLSRERMLELVIPDGIDVRGRVVDPEENPVPGAEIYRLKSGHHDHLQWTATADASGIFRLRDVAPGTEFVARAPGFQPSRGGGKGSRELRGDPGDSEEVVLVVGARGNLLTGRVVDEQGNPQPFARIALAVEEDTREDGISRLNRDPERRKPDDLEIFPIRADAAGNFTTDELPAGNATYFARTVGLEPRVAVGPLEVTAGAEHRLEIVVGPGASIFGVVTDTSGKPMRGFTVQNEWRGSEVLGAPEHDLGILLSGDRTLTDEEGVFQLFGLLPGEHGVEVLHPSGERMASERPELELGELFRWTPTVEVRSNLTVRVLGPDGDPLVGWGIGLSSRPGSLGFMREGRGDGYAPNATDENGRYRFENVRPRPQIVSVHRPVSTTGPPRMPVPVWIQGGVYPAEEEVVIVITTMPSGSIHGQVLLADGSVPRERGRENGVVQVVLADFAAGGAVDLDEEGRFAVEGLPAGSYALRLPRANDLPQDTELGTFELADGQDLEVGLLTPAAAAFLEVLLLDEYGNPLPDPNVQLTHEGDDSWGQNWLQDGETEGTLRSGALRPGVYSITFGARQTDVAPLVEVIELAPDELRQLTMNVTRGTEQVFELTLPPHPNQRRRGMSAPSARINLDLYDAEGNFILWERDHYELFDVSGNRLRITRALAPGTYRVRFEDHRDPPLSSPRPSAEIEVVVPANGDADVLLVELE